MHLGAQVIIGGDTGTEGLKGSTGKRKSSHLFLLLAKGSDSWRCIPPRTPHTSATSTLLCIP
jgi:hypothetical protein